MPTVRVAPGVELEPIVEAHVLRYWRRTGQWPSIRQTAKSLGFGFKRVAQLVRYSANMEAWELGGDEYDNEIVVQSNEVDSVLEPYWTAWQDQQLQANQM